MILMTRGKNFLKANSQDYISYIFPPTIMSENKLLKKVLCQKNVVMDVFLEI